MIATIASSPSLDLSEEVLALADTKGVSAELLPVLELTRQLFPTAPMTMEVARDPEIEDYAHIVFGVDVSGWGAERVVAADNEWTAGLLRLCPPGHALAFCLELQ